MDSEKKGKTEKSIKRVEAARNVAEKKLEEKIQEVLLLKGELKKINTKLKHISTQKNLASEGAFENINDGYIRTDLSGNVVKMNGVALDFFGYDKNTQRLSATDLIHLDDLAHGIKFFSTLFKEGVFANYRTRALTKEKQVKWI
jgi:PAS domain-containing protein